MKIDPEFKGPILPLTDKERECLEQSLLNTSTGGSNERKIMTEKEWVTFLYKIRGYDLPKSIFKY